MHASEAAIPSMLPAPDYSLLACSSIVSCAPCVQHCLPPTPQLLSQVTPENPFEALPLSSSMLGMSLQAQEPAAYAALRMGTTTTPLQQVRGLGCQWSGSMGRACMWR